MHETLQMKQKLPFILLIAAGLLIVFSFYGKALLQPNSMMFSNSGDGLKNYFTYSYHITHDSSAVGFEGMNYPYGENIMYTDCHPAFALLFRSLSGPLPFIAGYSVGMLNFLMILSIILTFIVVYLLLAEFGINRWIGLVFSIGITLLAPQIFRLGGHLALSYSMAIPLSWLLIIKSLKKPDRFALYFLILLNNSFWFFIHAYLGMIVTFFLLMVLIVYTLTERDKLKKIRYKLSLLASLAIPVVLFLMFIRLTDSHTGRTDNPSGFFQYVAEADDIFVPNHPPLRPLLDSLTGNGIRQQWEAWSYVGLTSTLLILILILSAVFRMVKRRTTYIDRFFVSRIMNASLLAALVVLLFAMAVPFRQFPALVDVVPFMKQFRALGRFTWPFFFVLTAFSAFVADKIYETAQRRTGRIAAIGFILIAGLLNIVEALPYHREMKWTINQSPNLFQRENLNKSLYSAIGMVNPAEYQAIISLPFFYQGSESYSRPQNDETVRSSIVISYHTGLPLVCANLTRTSIQESKNIVQIVTPDYYKKTIEPDLPDSRPFLVIRTGDPLTACEELLFRKCKPVFQGKDVSLYRLDKKSLFSNSSAEVMAEFMQKRASFITKDRFSLSDSSFVYYDSFEQKQSEHPFRGKGGFRSEKKNKNVLAEFAPGTFKSGKKYMASAWMFNGLPDALNLYFRFIIEEYDESADSWESTTCFPDQSETINGNWSLVEGEFEVRNPGNRIYIVTIGTRDAKGPLFIDDLLVREAAVDVYYKDDNDKTLFYNNHQIQVR